MSSSADFMSGARPLKDSYVGNHAGPSGSRAGREAGTDDRSDGEKEEDLLDSLDDDLELAGLRERRLEELRAEMTRKQATRESDFGRLTEIKIEKDLIQTTAKTKLAVVHFFHTDFRRCKIMDKHLESIAPRYFQTRFLKANVANVPFLVQKLEIKILPCVFAFVDGLVKDRIIGFEGIGETESDNFPTPALELRLQQSGVIRTPTREDRDAMPRSVFGATAQSQSAANDDDDWDD